MFGLLMSGHAGSKSCSVCADVSLEPNLDLMTLNVTQKFRLLRVGRMPEAVVAFESLGCAEGMNASPVRREFRQRDLLERAMIALLQGAPMSPPQVRGAIEVGQVWNDGVALVALP